MIARTLIATAALAAASSAALAQAPSPAVTGFTGGSQFGSFFGGLVAGDVVGFRFTSDLDQQVTALGVWGRDTQLGNTGLTSDHQVGLWRDSDQALLGTVTVSPSDVMIGDWHYADLASPVALSAGTSYTVGALYDTTDGDSYITSPTSVSTDGISFTMGVAPTAGDLGFTYPGQTSANQGRFGPNLLTAIPEPASMGLLAVSGLALVRRRRA